MRKLKDARRHFAHSQAKAIADLYIYAVEAGLHGATAAELFDGYCRKLVENGVSLLRGHVSTQTLHPQWTGYGYTWKRELNSIHEQQFTRVQTPSSAWLQSPFVHLIERAKWGEPTPSMRRRLFEG